jgi:hypothetical protein
VFERFTERARQVVVLAQEEARAIKHNYIGTEHILLGLLREEEGLAARVLASLGVALEPTRDQVTRIVGWGEEATSGQIPFTPRAKKVLELALREALSLGHNYIGTEHILLGLARENEGVAARILLDLGADSQKIRDEVIRFLSGPGGAPAASAAAESAGGQRGPVAGWLDGLRELLGRLAQEMRSELGRDPDPGDLLLVLACATHTHAGRAMRELGVDLDALWATIQRLRHEEERAQQELTSEIEHISLMKDQAIEDQRFEAAAKLRDQERELRERARARAVLPAEVLQEARRRLGIPGPEEETPRAPDDR